MQRLLITGSSSFIGYHLSRDLATRYQVIATTSRPLETYQGIQGERLERLRGMVEFAVLDLSSVEELGKGLRALNFDYMLHHAGYATNYGSLDYDFRKGVAINAGALFALYPALKGCGCRGLVITGSAMEYSDSGEPNCESDACYPSTPYGLAKLSETLAAAQLCARTGIPTRIARVYIPFGPLDARGKLLPQVIMNLMKNQPVDLSPCLQKRDFFHVSNLTALYHRLLGDLETGGFEIYNACSGEATELREVLSKICSRLEMPVDLLRFGRLPMRGGESMFSCGSIKKLRGRLGFEFPVPLDEGILDYLEAI